METKPKGYNYMIDIANVRALVGLLTYSVAIDKNQDLYYQILGYVYCSVSLLYKIVYATIRATSTKVFFIISRIQ